MMLALLTNLHEFLFLQFPIMPVKTRPTAAHSATSRNDTRAHIIAAAISLLNRAGRDAVTSRAVADAAGVQVPTIYRLFRDMVGLLDAVAEHGYSTYIGTKKLHGLSDDPVEDLRAGWSLHIAFGLSNPALYKLMYCDPQPGVESPAAAHSHHMLREHIHRVAVAGRLRVSEERAADLFHASACGIVLTLLATPEVRRDMKMAEIARESILAAITTEAPAIKTPGPAAAAVALLAVLNDAASLTQAERTMIAEWLERLVNE